MRPILALLLAIPLLAAGCVDAPGEVDAAAAQLGADARTPLVETPYTFDGSIGPAFIVCPLVTCEGADLSQRYTELPYEGVLEGLDLTMTWDASTPNMETLRFGVTYGESDYEFVEGSSPLLLELSDLGIDGDVFLWAWVVTPAPMGTAHAATPTDYHVEGTILTAEATA